LETPNPAWVEMWVQSMVAKKAAEKPNNHNDVQKGVVVCTVTC
jgi:hypothetical protein